MVSILQIILIRDPVLCVISTNTDSDYVKFIRCNFNVSYRRHVCNCLHVNTVGVCMLYLHAKFHMLSYKIASVIAVSREAKYMFF